MQIQIFMINFYKNFYIREKDFWNGVKFPFRNRTVINLEMPVAAMRYDGERIQLHNHEVIKKKTSSPYWVSPLSVILGD